MMKFDLENTLQRRRISVEEFLDRENIKTTSDFEVWLSKNTEYNTTKEFIEKVKLVLFVNTPYVPIVDVAVEQDEVNGKETVVEAIKEVNEKSKRKRVKEVQTEEIDDRMNEQDQDTGE